MSAATIDVVSFTIASPLPSRSHPNPPHASPEFGGWQRGKCPGSLRG